MLSCPKCSHINISGPTLQRDVFGEYLEYRCRLCGYKTKEPTHDTKKAPTTPEESN